MNRIITAIVFACFLIAGTAWAMDTAQHGGDQHGSATQHEGSKQQDGSQSHEAMEGMEHGSVSTDDKFVHSAMADDVHAEFQIMDLAGMNMKDPEGKTHHVMVTFMRDDRKIEKLAGKVKLIAPSGKEQIADLKDFGGGNFAANFTIDETGKWGVICAFKEEQGKHTVKFWYEHGEQQAGK